MGTGYLIDTNAVIEYLNNTLPEQAGNFIDNLVQIHLSVITRMELLSWRGATTQQIEILTSYIRSATVLGLSESVIEQTILIRKVHRIKLPDAIIAATALSHNLTLITRNMSDFDKIENLIVRNSQEL